ncbi:MAG: FecR family protein [Rhodospirillales bacterium]
MPDEIWHAAFDWLVARDGALWTGDQETAFQEWLAADPRHGQAYEQISKAWTSAALLSPSVTDTPHLADTENRIPPGSINRRQMLAGIGAMAAGLALFVGTGGARNLFADITTATGEFKSVTLEDGTHVDLDTDTALRVDFSGPERNVTLLGGRAYFDVARDARCSFAVTAGPARVSVLGTRFDLRMVGDTVAVAVEDGRVAIDLEGRNLTSDAVLQAGDRLQIDLGSRVVRKSHPAAGIDTTWRTGRLDVDDWSVADVLAELDRYHQGLIVMHDDAFGRRRVSGSYDLTRPQQAVQSVATAQGGTVRRLSPWILLVSPS